MGKETPIVEEKNYNKTFNLNQIGEQKTPERPSEIKDANFDQGQVNEAVELYKKTLGNDLEAQKLVQRSIEIGDNFELAVNLLEEQKALFEKHQAHFQRFMRNRLKNQKIIIKSKIIIPDVRPQLYTSQQRYDYLVEKHPLLVTLKERLRLEVDF